MALKVLQEIKDTRKISVKELAIFCQHRHIVNQDLSLSGGAL